MKYILQVRMKDILCGREVGARGLGRTSRVGRSANIKALYMLTWLLYYSAWTCKGLPTLVKPLICETLCRWVTWVVFCHLVNIKNHGSSVSTVCSDISKCVAASRRISFSGAVHSWCTMHAYIAASQVHDAATCRDVGSNLWMVRPSLMSVMKTSIIRAKRAAKFWT